MRPPALRLTGSSRPLISSRYRGWVASRCACVPIAAITPSRSRATLSASMHRGRPVRHHQRGGLGQQPAQRLGHLRLGVHVQRGQRVVQDQQRRPGQDGPGQRHPLPLAARQGHALLADPGVQAPGQVVHEPGLRHGQRRLDRGVVGVGRAVADVLPDAGREQRRVLERAADPGPQHRQRQLAGRRCRPAARRPTSRRPAGGPVAAGSSCPTRSPRPAPWSGPAPGPGVTSRSTGLLRARVAEPDLVEDQPGRPGPAARPAAAWSRPGGAGPGC